MNGEMEREQGAVCPASDVLQQLVVDVAEQEIMPRRQRVHARRKVDGSLVTDADLAAQDSLCRKLLERWPDIPLLGEEMSCEEQGAIQAKGEYWCLDPLDGTTNFANGIPFFAISLALVRKGRSDIGVVYDPNRGECFRADRGKGAWLNDQPLVLSSDVIGLDQCVALVDFKRLPKALTWRLAGGPPYRSQRSLGAVTLEWCWLAAGRCQLYLHGAQKPWDYAAGKLIFEEAGGVSCLLDEPGGECIQPAGKSVALAAIGASNQDLLFQWQAWISAAGSD